MESFDVKVHTLNHDVFFDWLGSTQSSLFKYYCDGFELAGSSFYGEINDSITLEHNEIRKTYFAKLKHFTNSFSKRLALFKLHGSIDNIIVHDQYRNSSIIKSSLKVRAYYKEEKDSNSSYKLTNLFDEPAPSFLSGTTNKIRYYTEAPHYINLFNHFKENLKNAKLLIVIGYGFNDSGVNDYLETNFLVDGKPIIVIDPNKPKTHFLDKYNATYIVKGVTEVSYDEYYNSIQTAMNRL